MKWLPLKIYQSPLILQEVEIVKGKFMSIIILINRNRSAQ